MPTSYQTETNLTCLVVNPDQTGAGEFVQAIARQGIITNTISETNIKSDKSTNNSYLVWFIQPETFSEPVVEAVIAAKQDTLSKVLLLAPLDCGPLSNHVKERCINLNNKLLTYENLDVRCVLHMGTWDKFSTSTQSLNNHLVSGLSRGHLYDLQSMAMYPCSTAQLTNMAMRVWFDRGHRSQAVCVRGQSISGSRLCQQLLDKYPQLTMTPLEPEWGSEPHFDGEMIEAPSVGSTDFINYLSEQTVVSTVKTAPPPAAPPKFQTVVVEETTTPAVLPALREVKKTINHKEKRKTPSQSRFKPLLTILTLLVGIMALPAGLVTFWLFQANQASPNLELSELTRRSGRITLVETAAKQLNLDGYVEPVVVSAEEHILQVTAEKTIVQAVKYMLTATEGDPYGAFQTARHLLDDLYLLQSTHRVSGNRQWTIQARQAIDLIPELIPADKKITLMILLQNNLELRPTGGFTGAVALLTFDHGKLLSYDTRDIYDLDSNLKGIVNPPAELRTYLGETSWYFRDANWYPDFLDTATTANWFLEKEWGSRADVVVGINLNTLKILAATLKSMTLPDGQVIGPDNLLATAFNYQDAPTGKPATKKQEFLSLFIKPLLDQMTTADPTKAINLIEAVGLAANQGELTVVSNNPATVVSLVEAGWSGKIINPVCQSTQTAPCKADFLAVNEANVGINKVNFYLKRQLAHTLSLSTTAAAHQHTITYTNQSPDDSWPGGVYKAYLRVLVPPEATKVTVTVNGNQLKPADATLITAPNYQQTGFFMEVKPQETVTVNLDYQLPLPDNYQSYAFTLQKQPGALADPLALTINPPAGRNFQSSSSNLGQGNGSVIQGVFDRSILTTIEMAQ